MASGWGFSGTTILQSGTPFTGGNTRAISSSSDSAGKIIGFAPNSGDFAATGDNFAYPNVTSYRQPTDRHSYLTGVVTAIKLP